MDKHESRPCVYVAYGLMGSTMILTKKKSLQEQVLSIGFHCISKWNLS